jgi:hypothetical protein
MCAVPQFDAQIPRANACRIRADRSGGKRLPTSGKIRSLRQLVESWSDGFAHSVRDLTR